MIPTIGRIVHYMLSEDDAAAINRRRKHSSMNTWVRENKLGAQQHVGNPVQAGDVFPMMIVKVWGPNDDSSVNGQVSLDGNDLFWVTSVSAGEGERHFVWPKMPRSPKAAKEGDGADASDQAGK